MDHRHYVPVLKWKLGEYQALMRLSGSVKDGITPLIEIPPVGYDHESQKPAKSLDDHLSPFARRLREKWQARPCFIDFNLLEPHERMVDDGHPVTYAFDQLRENSTSAIPVVRLISDSAYRTAVAGAVATDKRGACLRLTGSDFERSNLSNNIDNLLGSIGVGAPDVDLVLDLAALPAGQAPAIFARLTQTMIEEVPLLARWRSFIIAGSAYPKEMASIRKPYDLVQRTEWVSYKALVKSLKTTIRLPTFSDYATSHPDVPGDMDMRMVDPSAKIRYTTEDHWYIAQGMKVKANGFEQYRGLCATLAAQSLFKGASYSEGDRVFAECADGSGSTGNLTVWVSAATNHHLTAVVDDLANFHAS